LLKISDYDNPFFVTLTTNDRNSEFLKFVELVKNYPHIGFIIESNMDPDDDIRQNAIIVHAPNKFMSGPFDYSKRTKEVGNAIYGSSQLMD
jgi:hypothetical protein